MRRRPNLLVVAEAVEPVSEGEAEALSPALVPGTQAAGSADPSDYSVHDGDAIVVQAAETLGHYADWLNLRASHLRQLNRMSFGTPVVVGRKVKLQFSKITPDQFEAKRVEYHRQLQEAFFTQFRIKDTAHSRHQVGRVDLGDRAAALQHSDLAAAPVQPGPRSGRDSPGRHAHHPPR